MVSLRRRRLLGLSSGLAGKDNFISPLPLYCENLNASTSSPQHAEPESKHPMLSDDVSFTNMNTVINEEPGSSNVSASSSSKDLPSQQITVPPIKRRKQHRRKHIPNQEPCIMRGVYFKNMKWQAAIKVDKKQIHLGTVGSQEEAAHLYDRAAFFFGREPNFELSEEEKQELLKFTWDEFLAMTHHSITTKKLKGRPDAVSHSWSEPPPLQNGDLDNKKGLNGFSTSEDGEERTSLS